MNCAACGQPAEGNYSIEAYDYFDGPEVDLCDACGSSERPTMEELRAAIVTRMALAKAGGPMNCAEREDEDPRPDPHPCPYCGGSTTNRGVCDECRTPREVK